jgi:putative transposase
MLYGKLKKSVGEVAREVCRQRGIEQAEGHLMPDHIHMSVSIALRHRVAFAIGFIRARVRCESTGRPWVRRR